MFYTKKSFEKIIKLQGFELINFSHSAYTFDKDHQYQREAQDSHYKGKNSLFSINRIKKIIKKFVPKKAISFRQDFLQIRNIRNENRLNWFVNNTGDNCYIRGVLKKIN